jgi:sarcosine oxidase
VSQPDVVVVGGGALGSATAWQLARRGADVVLLEQFGFGHHRGASHGTSRILRRSYHTPAYVRLADEAYADWSVLEAEAGERLVTRVGGLDLFPRDAAIPPADYVASLTACGVPFEQLSGAEVSARWPALVLPEDILAVHQADTSIVPAGRGTATLQRRARAAGARLVDRCPVLELVDRGKAGVEVRTPLESYRPSRVVLTADSWTNDLLAPLGAAVPLTVTREQVTYFAPEDPGAFGPDRLPVWIWMDDPSFYGFPTYGESGTGHLVKAAQDCGGALTSADGRSFDTDQAALDLLTRFLGPLLPGVGPAVRTETCLYTLTPDRDFVLGPVAAHPCVLLGLGAGHGFKFAPTLGGVLADLVAEGTTTIDIAAFAPDRPALVQAGHPVSWLA